MGAVIGYSCKGISSQNSDPKSFKDKESTTGSGFHAAMKYVASNPDLKFALLENVKTMFHTRSKFDDECPMQIQTKVMEKAGFVTAFSMCVNSCEYGLSQSRTRAWVLYIKEPCMKCFVLEDIKPFSLSIYILLPFFKSWLLVESFVVFSFHSPGRLCLDQP